MTASMLSTDVLIVGAGPAGATAALNLASSQRVLLVEREAAPRQRIGESLTPAARRLLMDMWLWEDFLSQGHALNYGTLSYWGKGGTPVYHDFLRDLDGKGWHLDRARFESWLCANAKLRGACLLTNSRVAIISRRADGWEAVLHRNDDVLRVHARAMIDASGRNAAIARQLGARRRRGDKLICAWIYGDDRLASAELSHVEAEENGWWYSAPLPGRRRVLAFHTDADLAVAKAARTDGWLYEQAARLPGLGAVLDGAQFAPDSAVRLTAAHSSETVAPSGPGWLAVGDASLSFDPLSAQGLFHSLYTGLLGAEACYRGLVGESNAWNGYAEEIGVIASAYRGHLGQWYGAEQRWSEAPFWRRRQDLTSSHPATLV